jgi:hypothetical protein
MFDLRHFLWIGNPYSQHQLFSNFGFLKCQILNSDSVPHYLKPKKTSKIANVGSANGKFSGQLI